MNSENLKVNRLANEKSPYLKQHQHNPVDWFPWGEEAFSKAKSENKPVFLSVGYSTCHWCHVMEHESFSDPEVANLMNDVFVSIKVDREERPDIDHIYMTVCQMMTGSGGWPLTVLMTPDGKPFFAGTYFPKDKRGERPGIKDIITRTKEVWEKFRDDITEQADEITQQLNSVNYKAGVDTINQGIFRKGFYELASSYDELNGGFGNRPKFPIPHNFMFLLNYGIRNSSPEAIDMVANTLTKMRRGGIWDHVGYGFHRYSTDSEWLVPHFEKMLYDEALLAMAYTETYQVTSDESFKRTAREILKYLIRDMLDNSGAFYSAEDADSEGEEGKFYLWSIDEIRQILIGDVEFFCDVFNVTDKGNYYDEIHRTLTGKNILHLTKSLSQIADEYGISESDADERINKSLKKLFDVRAARIRPHLDNKILTDWNGLMIATLTKAASAFDDDSYGQIASGIIDFVRKNMLKKDYSLLHRYAEATAGIEGMIDDYACFMLGLLEFYQYSGEREYLELTEKIFDKFYKLFADENGGFFFTSAIGEKLIARKKEIYDGALPSGNSIVTDVLLRLYAYTHNARYYDIADKSIKAFASALTNVPSAYTYMLKSLDIYFNGSIDLVIVSGQQQYEANELCKNIRRKYNPNVNILVLSGSDDKSEFPDYIQNMASIDNLVTVYICSGTSCSEPIAGIENIRTAIVEQHGIRL
ncbi:MAG: thioredoxin domain-containing protein [Candidatus Kapabacteria bacterium]|nr:thioredoxin domain-containing protein [Ignavibacteriota bacterium]MCW5884410.1 thioredoxin domain-containing protein [Candidatus Kapabacteria bacterium]